MKPPKLLEPLIYEGIIDGVLRQLKGGKEATVYLVQCGNEVRCAKVYKEADKRSFRHATDYQEGRKVKNSRQARAMKKRSRFGREEEESAWHNTEVTALYTLAEAGVRVPKPFGLYDGVLIMEVVLDENGAPAPRLSELILDADLARECHSFLIHQVVLMLCAGLIHGDLSEYNILMGAQGPVIIDLPQVIGASVNNQAESLLQRDIENLAEYFGQFAPELTKMEYGKEIWKLYKEGALTPESILTGRFEESRKKVDVKGLMDIIDENREEEMLRRERKK